MNTIDYFKLQAKNLFRDYKTKKPVFDGAIDDYLYEYDPKYFDIDSIVCDFDLNEDNFSLMKAQHIVAIMAGFEKWADFLKASATELAIAKLLFDNQNKFSLDDWYFFLDGTEELNNKVFDIEEQLVLLRDVFIKIETDHNTSSSYRLGSKKTYQIKETPRTNIEEVADVQITSLPLSKADRDEFIETANSIFETTLGRMEPHNPELTRKLWDAGEYVDNVLLTEGMLPISKSYALSLIDAFLVHHVLGLATQSDKMAAHT